MKPPRFTIVSKQRCKLIVFVGRAKSGKSFLIRFICEVTGLAESDLVLLIDADEQADRDFRRWDQSAVKAMSLRQREDLAKITGALPPGCRLIAADLAGASQGFMQTICADRKLLEAHGIEIVPVIITTDIEKLSELPLRWLEIFKDCDQAFLILNQHDENSREIPLTALPQGGTYPKEVRIMHVPPLDSNAASEISRLACDVEDVLTGELFAQPVSESGETESKASEILADPLYQTLTGMWANETVGNLDPLISLIESALKESVPLNEKKPDELKLGIVPDVVSEQPKEPALKRRP